MRLTDIWVLKGSAYKDAWCLAYDASPDEEHWITTEKGAHILLNNEGQIIKGMGVENQGKTISQVTEESKQSSPSQPATVSAESPSAVYQPSQGEVDAAKKGLWGDKDPSGAALINTLDNGSLRLTQSDFENAQGNSWVEKATNYWKSLKCNIFAFTTTAKRIMPEELYQSDIIQEDLYNAVEKSGDVLKPAIKGEARSTPEAKALIRECYSPEVYYRSMFQFRKYYLLANKNFVVDISEKLKYKPSSECSFNLQTKEKKAVTGFDAHLATPSWADGHLTPGEMYALNLYTGNDYDYINTLLRARTDKDLTSWGAYMVNNLDSAMEKSVSTEPMVLYRVTKLPKDCAVGEVCEDLGYMSTTSVKPSQGYTSREARLTIRVPAGAHCISILGGSQNDWEREILFARGTKYRVLSYNKDKNTAEVEILLTNDEK